MNIQLWIRNQFRKRARIYIMPTKMGGYLNGLIFLMFLLAVGYNNNLLLIFTLFLFGLNLTWLIQTHFYLHGLKVDSIIIEDGHAKEKVLVHLHLGHCPNGPYEWEIELDGDKSFLIIPLDSSESNILGQVIFPQRMILNFKYLKVKTQMPFGLYKAWIYYPMSAKAFVYPEKLSEFSIQNSGHSHLEGENSTFRAGNHDTWNLAKYTSSDSRKISWKHYAKSGDLVIKEGEELNQEIFFFKYNGVEQDREFSLSLIATQMVQCAQLKYPFSLETPHFKMGPEINDKHLRDCLRELSKC